MAVGFWLWIECIIIEETVHEDVVGLMWHGLETSGGLLCELGSYKWQGICLQQNLASQEYCCGSDIVNN
jgi:hypothetical protein